MGKMEQGKGDGRVMELALFNRMAGASLGMTEPILKDRGSKWCRCLDRTASGRAGNVPGRLRQEPGHQWGWREGWGG